MSSVQFECLIAYCTPLCMLRTDQLPWRYVVIIEERPKSAIQALNKGVTKMFSYVWGERKITVGNIHHIPPSNCRAQHLCHVDIEVRAAHPKIKIWSEGPDVSDDSVRKRHFMTALALEIRQSMLYDYLDSAKNAWRFPFSIHGDTRQNLFWRWYKPKKKWKEIGVREWRGFTYMLRDSRLPTPTTHENNSTWRAQQRWLYLRVRDGRSEVGTWTWTWNWWM
jgi:hypothetical protein